MSRRKKHHDAHHEEHMDESWLIPYADILTLLLALFIVLFASAQVDQKKFDQMAYSFNAAFSGSPSVFDNNRAITPEVDASKPNQSTMDSATEQSHLKETVQLLEIKKQMDRYIQDNNLSGDLNTLLTDDGLMIRIKDSALFTSGSADLRPESLRLGEEIGKLLAPLSQKIVISGHTDNVPINTREFPSNWELSAKRSINFMKFLLSKESKLQPEKFSAIGYGEYRSLVPNDTIDGRAKNRRVEVLIMRNVKM
ncbi:flagellar motor protein MotB [Pelosinus sp. UFO1]|uniref:flagellar motor protein MotB n=1 Tax=Pelosinus sp. UFO1 TaxID=484770 RepID=UPI0004D12477|nr:flagellar motor protein MotB [Pelosinus sp. UFO1]AIF50808.1 Motility protein B, N-terminal domain containing protein [Pelosinus sp. UFO1]